jgi:hypothetical protein
MPPAELKNSCGRFFCKKLLLFLAGCRSRLSRLSLHQALLEFVHAAGGVHKFLRAGVKRMARVADAHDDHGLGGAGLDLIAAGATDFRVHIFRMNVRLHKRGANLPRTSRMTRGNLQELYHFSMTTGTNLGRAGSPLPAARPHNDCGAHGVTRPTHVPIPTGNWYYTPPIHLRSSQTALREVRLRESKMFFAAEISLPFFKLLKASLVLMATNCSTLGSR